MDKFEVDYYLNGIFGNIEIDIRYWRSMALFLKFGSDVKVAKVDTLKSFIATVLKIESIHNYFVVQECIRLVNKQKITSSKFSFLFDYSEKTIARKLKEKGLFENKEVDDVFLSDQSKDVKICFLIDFSNHPIDLLARWLYSVEQEMENCVEFKKNLKWINSQKKLEVARNVFRRILGVPNFSKDDMESFFFAFYVGLDHKRSVFGKIKADYNSLMHREKSDKKQFNVYIELKVFENIEKIFEENKMSGSELIAFLFDPKNKNKINELIYNLKRNI